jgi:multiple sugar transport system ATP-binding protein
VVLVAEVLLDDVSRVYPDGTVAVSRVTLAIRHAELMVIVGPSGSGKSTLLRLIAGLETPTTGTVRIGNEVVNGVPPHRRDIGMVFENPGLYPHLTTSDNLGFGLRLHHVPRTEVEQRVDAEARVLRLTRFLHRRPRTLSAGEQQRVAIGKATVRVPSVFLLDEPLTHLDAGERVRMRGELGMLLHGLDVTSVYVTHDQAQAMAVGDRVAVMRAGRIEQVAEPGVLYRRPDNVFVATVIGDPPMTLLAGRVEADGDRAAVVLGNQRLALPGGPPRFLRGRTARPVVVGLRPEHVASADDVPDARSVLFCTAARVEYLGAHTLVGCPVDTEAVTVPEGAGAPRVVSGPAELTARFRGSSRVRPGDRVELAVDTEELSYFDPVTGDALLNPG